MIEFFPLDEPRISQVKVLEAIEKAYEEGVEYVLLEAPVGSGKSAIAITVARYFQSKAKEGVKAAHILTPRKSLQDQYWDDYNNLNLCLMKGRSAYPCTYHKPIQEYNKVIKVIQECRKLPTPEISCADAPCVNKTAIKRICTKNGDKPCPYSEAIYVAQKKNMIVHNLHSFMFQSYFAECFDKRDVIIIDECHEMEGIIRDFAKKEVSIPIASTPETPFSKLTEWVTWFKQYVNNFSSIPSGRTGVSPREKFEELLRELETLSGYGYEDDFVVEVVNDKAKTIFTFTPNNISGLVNQFLLAFGNKKLLMSGTIYDKDLFCKINGIDPAKTRFIRISSTMPLDTRPIYLKNKYLVDTSYKKWNDNFKQMVTNIREVFKVFDDVKGIIHVPSYKASLELNLALKDTGRLLVHDAKNFATTLEQFYASDDNKVLVSPVCQQGVDFKYDRARFQIILRVPFLNVSDKFIEYKIKRDFNWYNHQALVVFGQQTGRINRADDDFGVTVLMDSRFKDFLHKNKKLLPKWLLDSVIRD